MSFYFVQYVIYSLLTTKFKHFQLPNLHNYFLKKCCWWRWSDGELPPFYTSRFCSAEQWTEVAVAACPTPSTTSGSAHHSSELRILLMVLLMVGNCLHSSPSSTTWFCLPQQWTKGATVGVVDVGKLPALPPPQPPDSLYHSSELRVLLLVLWMLESCLPSSILNHLILFTTAVN